MNERVGERGSSLLPRGAEWLGASVVALLLANLVPLAGVVFLGWEVFPVVFVFWAENLIVGAFNVLKMLTARVRGGAGLALRLFLVPFFCFHYGMFCLVHGVFVFALFGQGMMRGAGMPTPALVLETLTRLGLWWAVIGLLVSHGVSFVRNYLLAGERQHATVHQLMTQPYGRIVVLHLAILGGGFLVMALGSPQFALALLVLLKIGFDLNAHLRERRKFATASANATGPGTDGSDPA